MAVEDVAFSVTDGQTGASVSSGTLMIQATGTEGVYSLVGISGTIDGVSIDGLSDYLDADQTLTERPEFTRYFGFNVDSNGVGFSAGGVNYNLMATAGTSGQLGQGSETGLRLSGSNGSASTVSFTAAHGRTPCFTTGTLVRTMRGDVPVEALSVGDLAITASCNARPIRWIGCRDIVGSQLRQPELCPVRIRAGAFGDNLPKRDLCLSPGHPVLVGADGNNEGGHLVPIMCLINGTTIERAAVDQVTYWHVELDQHDILLAEGLPAESYIDLGSRPWFAGADGALYNPDLALPGMPGRCRPVAIDGPVVEAERRRLDAVFAARLEAACAWPCAGADLPLW